MTFFKNFFKAFTDQDFLRIWKGLFFCMWMSDKPLVQEQLAEDLAALVHCFSIPAVGVQFYGTFLELMCLEWFGLDQWRIDKFLMLVRRVTRQMFFLLQRHDWDVELIKQFRLKLNATLLRPAPGNFSGLVMHFSELFLEEVAKVSDGEIPRAKVTLLIKPFVLYLATAQDYRITQTIVHNIFFHLIKQSDMGREYQERYEIWKQAGCPTRSVDDIEIHEKIIEDSDNDEDDDAVEVEGSSTSAAVGELDPRAGMVSVVIPEIDFKPDHIIQIIEKVMFKPDVKRRNRQFLHKIIRVMTTYLEGRYPLGERNFPQPAEMRANLPNIDAKVKELEDFESEVYSESRQYKKIYKSLKNYKNPVKRANVAQKICEKLVNGSSGKIDLNDNNETPIKRRENLWLEEDATDSLSPVKEKPIKTLKRKQMDNIKKLEKSNKKVKKQPQENGVAVDSDELVVKSKKKKRTSLPMPETLDMESPAKKKNKLGRIDEEGKPKFGDETTPNRKQKLKSGNTPKIQVTTETENPKSVSKKTNDKKKDAFNVDDEWTKPLEDGEVELYMPSRKNKLKIINKDLLNSTDTEILLTPKNTKLLINPFAKIGSAKTNTTVKQSKIKGKQRLSLDSQTHVTASGQKRVKIALHKNVEQETEEYLDQVKSSPQVPYDSNKKPTKSLLKPNLMPSPINPFYKKKIGLNFDDLA